MASSAVQKKVLPTTDYNGMQFKTLAALNLLVRHEFVVSPNEKMVIDAPLTLQIHNNSYKYPDREVLLSSWSRRFPELRTRGVGSSQYWRAETILSKVTDTQRLRALRDFHFDCACSFDAVLKGIVS